MKSVKLIKCTGSKTDEKRSSETKAEKLPFFISRITSDKPRNSPFTFCLLPLGIKFSSGKLYFYKFLILVLLTIFLPLNLLSADISNISVSFKEDDLILSFRADEVFVEDVESRIKSGLEVVFRYEICIKKPRKLLNDPVLLRRILTTHVQYDPFKNQYKLLKKIDDKVVETKMTDSEREMRLWMTSFSNVRFLLLSVLKKGSKYYLSIKGDFLSSSFFFLIPTGVKADWKKIDFIFEG